MNKYAVQRKYHTKVAGWLLVSNHLSDVHMADIFTLNPVGKKNSQNITKQPILIIITIHKVLDLTCHCLGSQIIAVHTRFIISLDFFF